MHMWHHVTNHLIISIDKDSNSENRIKLHVRDNKHTRGDDEKAGTLQSMPTSEGEVQGLSKVCTGMDV
jgi:hypothetical protein